MAAENAENDWDTVIVKTQKYLSQKFGEMVAKHFMKYIEDYDELKDITVITDDLENEDEEDSWQNSNIVDEIGNNADLTDDKKKLLFQKLRVCFGLDDDTTDITLLNELQFSVTKQEIINARKYMLSQCPGLIGMEDQTLFKVIAIGIKNNIPLLSLLNDLFQYWKLNADINNNKIEHYSENEWVTKSKYLCSIKQKEVQHLIVGGLRSYAKRILPGPNVINCQFIDDSLTDYINIILSTSAMIKNVIETSENQVLFPFQFDLWIIPKEVNKTIMATRVNPEFSEDDDDTEDDDDDDDEKVNNAYNAYIDIGDIGSLLKKDKIKYEKTQIDTGNEANCIRIMRQNLDSVIGNKRALRVVQIVDRRNKKDNKCDLYSYQPPKPFGEITNNYCIEQLINNTSKYLISHPKDVPMSKDQNEIDIKNANTPIGGGYTGSGREFCLSFHIHSVDKISVYCWMHGFGVRFMPNYLIDILPKYFKIVDLKENKIDNKYISEKWKLNCVDPMFDAWNKLINEK